MSKSDELLKKWAAARTKFEAENIEEVTFRHIDGYTSDAGTYWPPEHLVYVKGRRVNNGNLGRMQTVQIYVEQDVALLLGEILSYE